VQAQLVHAGYEFLENKFVVVIFSGIDDGPVVKQFDGHGMALLMRLAVAYAQIKNMLC
jgi:hypothetical protein